MDPKRWSTMYEHLIDLNLKMIDKSFDPATAYTLEFLRTN